MSSALLAGVVAGLAVAMPIGAIGGYLVGLAARERLSTAAGAALGVASVDGAYAVAAALGGAGAAAAVQRVSGALAVVAAVVLLAVAARTWQLAVRRYRGRTAAVVDGPSGLTPARAYLRLAGLTAVNPATLLTFAAVVLGQGSRGGWGTLGEAALFAGGAFVASACWQLTLVAGGTALGRVLRGARGQLAVAGCSAALMVVLAGAVLLG